MKKLPTQEELNKAIQEFASIQWRNISIDNIEDAIPWPLKAIGILSLDFPNDKYIYRARSFYSFRIDSIDKDNIFLPSSFSYPPSEKAEINRANYKGQSIFYGASNLMAAIVESKSNGYLDFVGCWKVKNGKSLKIRPYISNIPKDIQNSTNNFISKIKQQYDKILAGLEDGNIIRLIDEFHDHQFTKQINNTNECLVLK